MRRGENWEGRELTGAVDPTVSHCGNAHGAAERVGLARTRGEAATTHDSRPMDFVASADCWRAMEKRDLCEHGVIAAVWQGDGRGRNDSGNSCGQEAGKK